MSSRKLDTSVGVPGPRDLAVRSRVARRATRSRPPHPAATSVTTRTPLRSRRDGSSKCIISDFRKEKFCSDRGGAEDRFERAGEMSFSAQTFLPTFAGCSRAPRAKIAQTDSSVGQITRSRAPDAAQRVRGALLIRGPDAHAGGSRLCAAALHAAARPGHEVDRRAHLLNLPDRKTTRTSRETPCAS
jgi:hypothetical protein